jgi:hypothetical protein
MSLKNDSLFLFTRSGSTCSTCWITRHTHDGGFRDDSTCDVSDMLCRACAPCATLHARPRRFAGRSDIDRRVLHLINNSQPHVRHAFKAIASCSHRNLITGFTCIFCLKREYANVSNQAAEQTTFEFILKAVIQKILGMAL